MKIVLNVEFCAKWFEKVLICDCNENKSVCCLAGLILEASDFELCV
uniref:Uncharacterized protein n=1 Tax=Anguilla anguilla TaxID=7936 RepID=A0A0E9WDE5_ANGAN